MRPIRRHKHKYPTLRKKQEKKKRKRGEKTNKQTDKQNEETYNKIDTNSNNN